MKRLIVIALLFAFSHTLVYAEGEVATDAKACILTEYSSGNVLYENNADERMPIASVTKVMTMLLIMEEIEAGTLSLDTMIPVSENAMSYGGSTMFLEAGEELSVSDMLKGIAVASANDGCVAMAEYISGSESAFVDRMNKRAAELGMENTHFMNTNGLDEDNHYSSARDVAIMSRELLGHEKIFDYTTIWTDSLRDGKFELANTNKLIRFYKGANGLKTGSTSKALCCLSASAKRDDMQLIAVVLGAPTSAKRFEGAKALLDYGFANYGVKIHVVKGEEIMRAEVEKGKSNECSVVAANDFEELVSRGMNGECERQIVLDENITAPLSEGDKIGTMQLERNGETIGEVDLLCGEDIEKQNIFEIMQGFLGMIFG